MQFHGERRIAATSDYGKLKQSDLHLPYMGKSEDRTLYVQNVPETWDKWKLLHIFRQFGRIDNIKIVRKHDESLTCAFIHMMSIADANSVITATAHDDGKILLPELSKPLKIQFVRQKGNTNWKTDLSTTVERETERMKSYFSIIDRPELALTEGNVRKPIIYHDRLHRHDYLPLGKPVQVELVQPITENQFLQWPMMFYVFTETHECEAENLLINNEDLDGHIAAHFKRAPQVTHVVENELLVAAPREPNQVPLRCRVLEKLDDEKIRIYALDIGQTLVVQMSELKIISEYLASVPARAIPCVLYGVTKPTARFANVARRILENITRLAVLVVSFEGGIALVRAFKLNGLPVTEIAQILTYEGACDYKPPNKRKIYPRETILSLRAQKRKLSILNDEVADAILI
ncbi:Tudor domain family protein [Brugia pahangi]